jgi:DNA mismatch repair ATPase MutS
LTDMTSGFEGLACYCTNVVEEGQGRFRYDHKVRRGVNRQSHALKVAKLAGMPQGAIEVAKGVLKELGDESVFVDG